MTAATSDKTTWELLKTNLQKMGGVANVMIGRPKSGIQSGLVAVIPDSGEVGEATLSSPREIHFALLRRYESIAREPQENVEFTLDGWRSQVWSDIWGDFDLGGNIAYAQPTLCSWKYDEEDVGNQTFRTCEIRVAYRVDDRATFTV